MAPHSNSAGTGGTLSSARARRKQRTSSPLSMHPMQRTSGAVGGMPALSGASRSSAPRQRSATTRAGWPKRKDRPAPKSGIHSSDGFAFFQVRRRMVDRPRQQHGIVRNARRRPAALRTSGFRQGDVPRKPRNASSVSGPPLSSAPRPSLPHWCVPIARARLPAPEPAPPMRPARVAPDARTRQPIARSSMLARFWLSAIRKR